MCVGKRERERESEKEREGEKKRASGKLIRTSTLPGKPQGDKKGLKKTLTPPSPHRLPCVWREEMKLSRRRAVTHPPTLWPPARGCVYRHWASIALCESGFYGKPSEVMAHNVHRRLMSAKCVCASARKHACLCASECVYVCVHVFVRGVSLLCPGINQAEAAATMKMQRA